MSFKEEDISMDAEEGLTIIDQKLADFDSVEEQSIQQGQKEFLDFYKDLKIKSSSPFNEQEINYFENKDEENDKEEKSQWGSSVDKYKNSTLSMKSALKKSKFFNSSPLSPFTIN